MDKVKIALVVVLTWITCSAQAQTFNFTPVLSPAFSQFKLVMVDANDSFWTYRNKPNQAPGVDYFKSADGINWHATNKTSRPSNFAGDINLSMTSDKSLLAWNFTGGKLGRSVDGGLSWTDLSNSMPAAAIALMNLFTGDGNRIYLNCLDQTGSASIYTSNDKGSSWSKTDSSLRFTYLFNDYIHVGNNGIIFLYRDTLYKGTSLANATAVRTRITAGLMTIGTTLYAAAADTGLVYSVDSGFSWLPLTSNISNVEYFEGMDHLGDTMIAWNKSTLCYSKNRGVMWDTFAIRLDCRYSSYDQLNSIALNRSGNVLATNYSGALMKTNWATGIINDLKTPQVNPSSLSIYGDNDQKLSALVNSRIYTFEGGTWQPVTCGDPEFKGSINKKYGRLYFYANSNGIVNRVSTNNGNKWSDIQFPAISQPWPLKALPIGADSFMFFTPQGTAYYDSMYISDAQGNIRSRGSVSKMRVPNSSYRLYSMGERLLYFYYDYGAVSGNVLLLSMSGDYGKNWANVPLPRATKFYDALATDSSIYLAFYDNKLYRSRDYGQNWDSVTMNGKTIQVVDVHGTNGFYALCSDSAVYYVNDAHTGTPLLVFRHPTNTVSQIQVIGGHLYIRTIDNTIWYDPILASVHNVKVDPKQALQLYPVPTGDFLHVDITNGQGLVGYCIFNISGQAIMKKTFDDSSQIDVSALTPGIYFVEINFDRGQHRYGKFIKE